MRDTTQTEGQEDELQVLRKGKQLVNAGQYQRAIRVLRPSFGDSAPSHAENEQERIASWLARAYLEQGQLQQAFTVLRNGGKGAVYVGGTTVPRLADVFIQEVMRQASERHYERAARLYRRILRRSGERMLSDVDRAAVHRHLREIAVVLPEHVRKQTGLSFDAADYDIRVDPEPDAGDILVKWWRRQDPIPATRQNERLHEHLERVAYAREHYLHKDQLDDRGKVYIRFGEPHRDVSIGMKHEETLDAVDAPVRRNEFWTYHHVHPKAYYLFVEVQPNTFRVSGVHDLFPPDMKTGVGEASSRSRGKTLDYLYKMEEVLRELATFHEDYATRATDVADRAAWARDNEQYDTGSDPVDGPAGNFVQSMESRIENIERQNAAKRAEAVPQAYTAVSNNRPDLPIAARKARFLTPEGRTKTEVYWSIPSSALSLPDDRRDRPNPEVGSSGTFLWATVRQENADHLPEELRKSQFLLQPSGQRRAVVPPRTFSTVADDSLFHLALQWDQYTTRGEEGNIRAGDLLRRHTERYDSLRALDGHPETLEMSDLKLLTVPTGEPVTAVTSDKAIPYPFEQIRTQAPLALTFQVYHLEMSEERTRYTVSHRVRKQTKDDGFLGLFGEDDEVETTTVATYRGKRQRTTEYIEIDLDDFIGDVTGTVELEVTVTDEVTGQQVTRSLSFETVASDES